MKRRGKVKSKIQFSKSKEIPTFKFQGRRSVSQRISKLSVVIRQEAILSAVPQSLPYRLLASNKTAGTGRLLGSGGRPACRRGRHPAARTGVRINDGREMSCSVLAGRTVFPPGGTPRLYGRRDARRYGKCGPACARSASAQTQSHPSSQQLRDVRRRPKQNHGQS